MKRFHFRLEKLLTMEERRVEGIKLVIAGIAARRRETEVALHSLETKYDEMIEEHRRELQGATLRPEEINGYARRMGIWTQRVREIEVRRDAIDEELAVKRRELNERRGNLRVLERRREEAIAEWKNEQRREDWNAIDEFIGARWGAQIEERRS